MYTDEKIISFFSLKKKKRFQNRRAKEKRLKKDSGRRWSNVLHNEDKTVRTKTRKSHNMNQEEDTSNEGDTAVSYDGKV